MDRLWILAAALIADRLAGDPDRLWNRARHPVEWMGALIGLADRWFNRDTDEPAARYRHGAAMLAGLVAVSLGAAWMLETILAFAGPAAWLLEGFVVFSLLAQKSLRDHVGAVRNALQQEGLEAARKAIGRIVGRDPRSLDRSGISRAAIESLAENFSDGVVAPAFWYAIFGLPGIIAYKMINTADSMIGHRSSRYRDFGRVTAQADDLANWLPARLSALLIALGALAGRGAKSALHAMQTALRDAGLHDSPNAGWPEAAMAGVCDIALGGPRRYEGTTVAQSPINAGGKTVLDAPDITAAIAVFDLACTWLLAIVLAAVLATWM